MTAVDLDALDKLRSAACEVLYPGLFADEAYRRHPQQVDRVAPLIAAARKYRALREAVEGLITETENQWPDFGPTGDPLPYVVTTDDIRAVVATVDGEQ